MKSVKTKITGYGYDGEGVCRVDGKVAFVPFVVEGEEVEISLEQETSSFFKAKLLNICSPSPLRQTPPCPYFSKCGGCAYQHVGYQTELEIKKELLSSQLKKCGYSGEIFITPSQQRFEYRNKIKLFAGRGKIGLKYRKSNEIIDIEKCLLVSENINNIIEQIRLLLKQDLIDHFKEIVIREEEGQILLNFYRTSNKNIDYHPLLINGNIGIFETYQNKTRRVEGIKQIQIDEFGLKCSFKPNSFHQVNKFVMPKLYEKAIELVKGDNILNCYSGAGVLSGVLAEKFKRVVGIELGDSEHEDAQKFKQANNLNNLLNIHGDCGKVLKTMDEKFDTIILDPPKAGADRYVCQALNDSDAERIIYISCDSGTMARDVERMTNYKVTYAHLFDMFSCTGEYESLIMLEKR